MKKQGRIVGILLSLVLLMSSMTVFAAGTSSVALSKTDIKAGDTFTATVSATESGKITVKFNTAVLQVTNCNVSGYSAQGDSVVFQGKNGTITFKATAEGKSSIAVSSDKATGCSATVTVGAGEAPVDPNGDFTVDNVKYVVSEKFADSEIPAGFNKVDKTIHGHTYKVLTNNAMTLVYLKPVDNVAGAGTFFVFDEGNDSVSPFNYIGTPSNYVILKNPTNLINDKMTQGTIEVDGKQVGVYLIDGMKDFAYVYGVGVSGTEQWYQYDTVEKTLQRANVDALSNVSKEEKVEEKGNSPLTFLKELDKRYYIGIGVVVLIIIVVVVVNVIIKKRKKNGDDDIDEFDNDDMIDDFDLELADEIEVAKVNSIKPELSKTNTQNADVKAKEDVEDLDVEDIIDRIDISDIEPEETKTSADDKVQEADSKVEVDAVESDTTENDTEAEETEAEVTEEPEEAAEIEQTEEPVEAVEIEHTEEISTQEKVAEDAIKLGSTQVITLEEELIRQAVEEDKLKREAKENAKNEEDKKPKKKGFFAGLDIDVDDDFFDDDDDYDIDDESDSAFWEDDKDIRKAEKEAARQKAKAEKEARKAEAKAEKERAKLEKQLAKEEKQRAKAEKRNKNIFGDDEDIFDDVKVAEKPKKSQTTKETKGSVDVIDLNDL